MGEWTEESVVRGYISTGQLFTDAGKGFVTSLSKLREAKPGPCVKSMAHLFSGSH